MAVTTDASGLGMYLQDPNIDTDRATFILDLATKLAQSVINPLPDGAEAVIYPAAARAYTNPAGLSQESLPAGAVVYGNLSGLFLTSKEVEALEGMTSGGTAFVLDTMPADAADCLPWWTRGWPPYGHWSGRRWDW